MRNFRIKWPRKWGPRKWGQTLPEFIIVGSVVFFSLFVLWELTLWLHYRMIARYAAFTGARSASVHHPEYAKSAQIATKNATHKPIGLQQLKIDLNPTTGNNRQYQDNHVLQGTLTWYYRQACEPDPINFKSKKDQWFACNDLLKPITQTFVIPAWKQAEEE